MRLGLVLLPPDDVSTMCVQYARKLADGRSARVIVGPGMLPHVTLLHVETEGTDLEPARVFEEARAALLPSYAVSFLALGLLRYDTPYNAPPSSPATMAWLIIPCTPALRDAEQRALALPFARRAIVTTSQGDAFQPHVTLAIWDGELAPATHSLPPELYALRDVKCRLALGVIGPNGTYERTLFEV